MNDHMSISLHLYWDKQLEWYSTTNIIDAIQHTPIKKYTIKYSPNDMKDTWTFTNPKHIDLYKRFLDKLQKHFKESHSTSRNLTALKGISQHLKESHST